MKRSLTFFIAVFYMGLGYGQATLKDFSKLYWLEGTWEQTNAKAGTGGTERWAKISPVELQGTGVTLKGSDTAFIEKFKLVTRDNFIYYVADVPENKQPVEFKLTSITESGFICENATHDFPKKIMYRREGDKIIATISGNGKSRDYLFKRK